MTNNPAGRVRARAGGAGSGDWGAGGGADGRTLASGRAPDTRRPAVDRHQRRRDPPPGSKLRTTLGKLQRSRHGMHEWLSFA